MRRKPVENEMVSPEPLKKKTKLLPIPAEYDLDASFVDDEALPPGLILTDIMQRKWRIGKPIGRGSFGRIYLASDDITTEVTKQNARYVVKIEPHSNGPLFVEIHCLIRTAKPNMIKSWRENNQMKKLGMPSFIASGSHTHKDTRNRFLVLPRYGIDLHKIIARRGVLDLKNVLILAIQILDVLEYFHKSGYTHSDIKSSNLMIGFEGSRFESKEKNQIVQKSPSQKSRISNYYNDEDFVIKDYKEDSEAEIMWDMNKLAKRSTKTKKLCHILYDKKSRSLHRHHAFNLRQLSNNVNYEDLNSTCSDQSYQRLLDETKNYHELNSSDEGFHEFDSDNRNKKQTQPESSNDDYFVEAITSQTHGQIYLLDYGLVSKFMDSNGVHKEFGMDQRKAHDGTLEYSSRDSHIGAHSRRSDLENLGFNLLDWLTGTLPWKTTEVLAEPDLVHALKKNYMQDVKSLLKACFKTDLYPEFMEKYLLYMTGLDFKELPDYNHCRNIFRTEYIRNFGKCDNFALTLLDPSVSPNRKKINYSKKLIFKNPSKNTSIEFLQRNGVHKIYGRENVSSLENDLKMELLKRTLNLSNDSIRKPCTSRNFFISDADLVAKLKQSLLPGLETQSKKSPKNLRSKKRVIKRKRNNRNPRSSIGKFGNFLGSGKQFTWAEILAGNPEDIIRKDKATNTLVVNDSSQNFKTRNRKISNASETSNREENTQSPLSKRDYLSKLNPTYAMKEVFQNFRKRMNGKVVKDVNFDEDDLFKEPDTSGNTFTPIMLKILRNKEKREAKERALEEKERLKLARSEAKLAKTKKSKSLTNNKKTVDTTPKTLVNPKRTSTRNKIKIVKKSKSKIQTPQNKIRKSSVTEVKTCTVLVNRCKNYRVGTIKEKSAENAEENQVKTVKSKGSKQQKETKKKTIASPTQTTTYKTSTSETVIKEQKSTKKTISKGKTQKKCPTVITARVTRSSRPSRKKGI